MAQSNTPNKSDIIWDAPPADSIVWDAPKKETPMPPMSGVLARGLNRGVAAAGDMFLNAPANAWNLGQGAIGYTKELLGNKDAWLDTKIISPPNLVHKAFEQVGLIRPEHAPQTPGQRIADTAAAGAGGAIVGPGGLLRNAATGMVSGGAGQAVKEVTGSDAAQIGTSLLTPMVLRAAFAGRRPLNEAQQNTLNEGREAGYVLPPSEVNPSFVTNRLESIAGKAAIKQEAVGRNQNLTNALVARQLGLPPGTALTPNTLQQERAAAGQPYAEAAALRPNAQTPWFPRYHNTDMVHDMRQARADANNIRRGLLTRNDPDAVRRAQALEQEAQSIEGDIGTLAQSHGRNDLVQALADSRRRIAQLHDVENASSVTGEVSAPALGRMLDSGQRPLTGNLEMIGRYQQTFPKFMGEGAKSPTPGVSAVEPLSMAGLGMGGSAALGPAGWLAGGLPLVRGPMRSALLSQPYQRFATSLPEGMDETTLRSLMIANAIAARQQQGVQ